MPPSKRLCFDNPDWTRRKAAIEEMYVFGRLSQKKIRDKLEEDGFLVTKSELEAQLRFWNIRKNASAVAWRYTDHKLLKREQQGKASAVYYNRRKVSCNTLKKERSRYQPDALTKYTTNVESPKTPKGMELCIRTPTPTPTQLRWPQTLPWLRFQDTILPFILNFTNKAIDDEFQRPDSWTQLAFPSIHQRLTGISLDNVCDVAANIASMMPEKVENEISNRAQLIVHGSADQAFNEHIKLILYYLSNNMYHARFAESPAWGAIVNLIDRSGLTNQPLDLAQQDSTVTSIAENLFKLCIEFHIHGSSGEEHASNSKVISWLLNSGQNPDVDLPVQYLGRTIFPLQDAANAHECELAIKLLDAGADPNGRRGSKITPLLMLLSDEFQQFNDMTPGEHDIFLTLVERLLEAGNFLNEKPTEIGASALMLAICLDFHVADVLIQHGANIKHQSRYRESARYRQPTFCQTHSVMGFSMQTGNEENAMRKMKHLLGHVRRSEPSASISDLITGDVLCIAAERGFDKIVKFCCGNQQDMVITEDIMFSALCAAAYQGHRETCELLLQYGAPVNGPDHAVDVACPLHFAALSDHFDVVELLCEYGADVNAYFEDRRFEDDGKNYMWDRVFDDCSISEFKDHKCSLYVNALGASIIGAATEMPSSFPILTQYGASLPIWAVYHAACRPPYPWIVHYAAEHGADLNWRGPGGKTALQTALSRLSPMTPYAMKRESRQWVLFNDYKDDYLEVISSLVNACADTRGSECELVVLLEHYSLSEDVSLRNLQGNSRCTLSKLSTLAAAFLTRSTPKINQALTESPNAYDPGALCASVMLAISSGATDLAQRLLHNRPGDFPGRCQEGNALGLACWYNRMDIVDILLSKMQGSIPALIPVYLAGPNPELKLPATPRREDLKSIISQSFEENIPIWHREPQFGLELLRGSPLTLSIWSQECLDKLLENNIYPDRLTISVAVCHGDVETLAKLVRRRRVDNSHADRPGPLYLSVERRFKKMTEVLLKAGFSPNEPNDLVRFGRSPLQKAVEDGILEVIDLLLEAGADVNAPAAMIGGATALQLAAITGRLGIAKRLIDLRANVNASGAETGGRTALEGAAEHGRLDMVQFLIDCGANVIGNGCLQYFKAIRFAQLQGHRVVADLLLFHREWTSFEDDIWQLVLDLDNDGLEELGSLEDLIVSSATSATSVESSSSRCMDEDSPEETLRLGDDTDCHYDSGQKDSCGEGGFSLTEAKPMNESSARLQNSAMSAGIGHDNMMVEDHPASHIFDDTTWIQHFGNGENVVQTSWDVEPIEALHSIHAVQGFHIPHVNTQLAWTQQPGSVNQDFQAAWEPGLLEGFDNDMRMEQRCFPAMNVDSAWNSQLVSTDVNDSQRCHGTETESGICYEIFEGDINWPVTENAGN